MPAAHPTLHWALDIRSLTYTETPIRTYYSFHFAEAKMTAQGPYLKNNQVKMGTWSLRHRPRKEHHSTPVMVLKEVTERT